MTELERRIDECEQFLRGYESCHNSNGAISLAKELLGAFSQIPGISTGLFYDIYDPYSEEMALSDLRILLSKLRFYRDEKEQQLELARLNAAQRGATIMLKDVGNSSSTSVSQASVSYSQVTEAVDADVNLTETEKAELLELLAQAKKATVRKDNGAFAGISSKIMAALATATPGLIVKLLEYLISLAIKLACGQ